MKKLLLTIIISGLSTLFIQAQVVLDHTLAPAYGTIIKFINLEDPSGFVFDKSGENLFWSFIGIPVSGIDSVFYDDPANTPYFAEFPDAALAVYQGEDGIGYITYNENIYGLIGAAALFEGDTIVIEFNPVFKLFTFPYTYGSAVIDTASFTIEESAAGFGIPFADSVRLKVSLITDRNVQGWGTLELPHATYEGTLLEKSIETQIDSLWIKMPFIGWIPGTGYPQTSVDSSYRWLTGEILHPFAEAYYDEGVLNNVYYYYDNTLGFHTFIPEKTATLQLWPNPAFDFIKIESELILSNPAVVSIYNLNGRLVLRESVKAGESATLIDINKLKPGIYSAVLQSAEGTANCIFIKMGR